MLLGGLVPDLLCSRSSTLHVGTTDVDVQVNLEIANGSPNAARLEAALLTAGFTPDRDRVWRWSDRTASGLVVKVEFLADLDDVPSQATLSFDDCHHLGAVNLRGTGFATRGWHLHHLIASEPDGDVYVELQVAGLAGYLLAKIHAAYGRRATKDWYDIAYVLVHNDAGGPGPAASAVLDQFGGELVGQTRTALDDLASNFADPWSQGAEAYAGTMLGLYPEFEWELLANDAVAAVTAFVFRLSDSVDPDTSASTR